MSDHVTEAGVSIPRLQLDGEAYGQMSFHCATPAISDRKIVESLLRESKSCDTQINQSIHDDVRGQRSDLSVLQKTDEKRKHTRVKDTTINPTDNVIVGERSGTMQKLRLDAQIAAVSRNRAIFNRNMDTLPDIGRTTPEVSFYTGTMPSSDDIEGGLVNPAIDVMNRNAAKIRATAQVREISHNFIKSAEHVMKEWRYKNVPDMMQKTVKEKMQKRQ